MNLSHCSILYILLISFLISTRCDSVGSYNGNNDNGNFDGSFNGVIVELYYTDLCPCSYSYTCMPPSSPGNPSIPSNIPPSNLGNGNGNNINGNNQGSPNSNPVGNNQIQVTPAMNHYTSAPYIPIITPPTPPDLSYLVPYNVSNLGICDVIDPTRIEVCIYSHEQC